MGWWTTNKEGVSFTNDRNPDDTPMMWGDAPADCFNTAIDEIVDEFFNQWDRPPSKEELVAGFAFAVGDYDPAEVT